MIWDKKNCKKKIQKDHLQIMQRQEDIFKHPPRQRRSIAQLTRPLLTIRSSRHPPALPIDQNNGESLRWNHHHIDIQATASTLNRCLGASWRLVKLKLLPNSPKHKSHPLSNKKSTTLQNDGQVDHTRSRRRCRRWVHRPRHDLASLGEQDAPSGINGLNCCSSSISWQRSAQPNKQNYGRLTGYLCHCGALMAFIDINANTKPKIR